MTPTPDELQAIEVARQLAAAGVPIFLAEPARKSGRWDPAGGHAGCGYTLPNGWQNVTADPKMLDRWRPRVAVCAVMGHRLDLVDVDPRNGGDPETVKPHLPAVHAVASTPSGGWHAYVRTLGIRSRDNVLPGVDIKAGDPDGQGRGCAFIAPTVRKPKTGGDPVAYRWERPPDLNALSADDGTQSGRLVELVAAARDRTRQPTQGSSGFSSPAGFAPSPLSDLDATIAGNGRHAAVVKLASALRGRGGWRVDDALTYMRDVVYPRLDQARGGHPYTLDELEQDVRDVFTRYPDGGDLPRPTRPLPDGAPLPPRDSKTADQLHERLVEQETARLLARDEARRRVAAQHAEGTTLPQLATLTKFLDEPDPEVAYRIEGLWPADGRVLLAAQYKAGKTTSVGNVLRALVDGEPLFDTYAVTPPAGNIVLLDDELHENTLRRWLRGQGIVNTDRVRLVALRGKLSTFDLLDETVRQRWAEQIAEAGGSVVILDCLRPIIDALGLSEDKDTGRVLTAFDEMLDRAGVSEGMIVHHMGHTGERSRGDSRLRDWPDAEWKIVRQRTEDGEDDPAAPRFFSAFGRDVEVGEQRLGLADDGRRLYIAGGSRRESAELELRDAVVRAVTEQPGMTATELRKVVRDDVGGQSAAVDRGRDRAVRDRLIEVRTEGRSKLHYPHVSTVSDPVQDAWTHPGGERVHVPIGGTGHVTTASGPESEPATTGHGHDPAAAGFHPNFPPCRVCGDPTHDATRQIHQRCVNQEGAA